MIRAEVVLPVVVKRLEDAYQTRESERDVWELVYGMGFSPNDVAAAVLREAAVAAAKAARRRIDRSIEREDPEVIPLE